MEPSRGIVGQPLWWVCVRSLMLQRCMMRKYKTLNLTSLPFVREKSVWFFKEILGRKKTLEFLIVTAFGKLYIGSNAVHHTVSFLKHLELIFVQAIWEEPIHTRFWASKISSDTLQWSWYDVMLCGVFFFFFKNIIQRSTNNKYKM